MDVLATVHISDPEELIISNEEKVKIQNKMYEVLSELEMEVLRCYLDGKSYQEIACDLDRHAKSIDNALQRVKRKLEKFLKEQEVLT
jgi:RNA polymerase sporulation-specific sigma factor